MREYLVFARDDFERELECVGELEAFDDETARERARAEHTGQVEMVLVPAEAAHWVVRPAARADSGVSAAGSEAL